MAVMEKTILEKGLPIRLKNLEEKWSPLSFVKDSPDEYDGYFDLNVSVSGVREPISVRFFFRKLNEEYVQMWGTQVIHSSVDLGEKRKANLQKEIHSLLSDDNLYIEDYHIEDAYVYAKHYTGEYYRYGDWRKGTCIPIIESSQLEALLIEERAEKRWGRAADEYTVEYFYHPDLNQLLIRENKGDEDFYTEREKEIKDGNIHSLTYFDHHCVDENGKFYRAKDISDSENIRLIGFDWERSSEEFFLKVDTGEEAFTYTEMQINFLDEKRTRKLPTVHELPETVDRLTFLSERVIGKSIPEFQKGQWVQMGEKSGKVISQSKVAVEVQWDGVYYPEGYDHHIRYHKLKMIEDPTIKMGEEFLVGFSFSDRRVPEFVAFGTVMEETPEFYKVLPLDEKVMDYVITEMHYDRHYRKREEIMARLKEVHGDEFMFLYVPKNQIEMEWDEEIEKYQKEVETGGSYIELLTNLFKLQGVEDISMEYLLVQALKAASRVGEMTLLVQMTSEMTDGTLKGKKVKMENIYEFLKERK